MNKKLKLWPVSDREDATFILDVSQAKEFVGEDGGSDFDPESFAEEMVSHFTQMFDEDFQDLWIN